MARFHSIITVTQGGILYRDIAEIVRWVDFRECLQNYCVNNHISLEQFNEENIRCVGRSSFYSAPLAYIEFFTEPILRLEFDDPEELWNVLKEMQLCGGWFALNLD